jgi:ABC-type transporter Mla maintaining outer membrane lipid asymmetry ATPase subunit MlaF
LRLESLILVEGERVAVLGIDSAAAEVLVNLVTGAALPEEGTVRVLGHDTTEISSGDQWLASLDRFGIVSPRAVLIESATVEQNLAMPFTLRIDAIPADVTARVAAMAEECGIQTAGERLKQVIGDASPGVRVRVHLARAVALDPSLLLLEHPSAGLPEARRAAFADDVVRVVEGRRVTTLAITQDRLFAARVAQRTFELQPASGALRPVRKGWFS